MVRFSDGAVAREAGQHALARADDFTWAAVARRVLGALDVAPLQAAAAETREDTGGA